MAFGNGLHIRRVDNIGNNWFPFWNAGPLLPSQLQDICRTENVKRPKDADQHAGYDEEGNLIP